MEGSWVELDSDVRREEMSVRRARGKRIGGTRRGDWEPSSSSVARSDHLAVSIPTGHRLETVLSMVRREVGDLGCAGRGDIGEEVADDGFGGAPKTISLTRARARTSSDEYRSS